MSRHQFSAVRGLTTRVNDSFPSYPKWGSSGVGYKIAPEELGLIRSPRPTHPHHPPVNLPHREFLPKEILVNAVTATLFWFPTPPTLVATRSHPVSIN